VRRFERGLQKNADRGRIRLEYVSTSLNVMIRSSLVEEDPRVSLNSVAHGFATAPPFKKFATLNEPDAGQGAGHATPEEAAASTTTPFDSFSTQEELVELAKAWPPKRLLAIWSSLPGVRPIRRFKDYKAATPRIWERIQALAEPAPPPAQPAKPKAARHAKGGAQAAKGAPVKGKAAHKATPAKKAPPAKKAAAAAPVVTAARPGSKTAQVVAMLQRKNGATLAEIMRTMGWQKHTVRGFMAGAMKKAGHAVESFKPAGGERTYRLN